MADHQGTGRLFALDRLEAYERLGEATGQVIITARLRQNRLDLARRILGTRRVDAVPSDPGWCTITLRHPDVESVRQLLQFADHLEVVAPAEARQRIQDLAADLASRHAPASERVASCHTRIPRRIAGVISPR